MGVENKELRVEQIILNEKILKRKQKNENPSRIHITIKSAIKIG